ncbi:MAG: ABC transporter ATP-binding protein [Hyphomicrobiaceae bacterium]
MAIFEARKLHKRFGDQVVLEQINLTFEEGRLSGIMGPNGAGKTTCFNVLTGRYRPNRGEVIFKGENITGLSPEAIVRKGISRSFQIMNLFDEYTALQNIVIALPVVRSLGTNVLHAVDGDSAIQDRAADILDRVGLAGSEHRSAMALSYGQRRALEIGVALATDPEILFVDEPTAGLGADATRRLADLIRELKSTTTIVMIEHDMRFLFELADQISVIHWGQVISQGTPDELRTNSWVQRSNLGALA